MPLNVPEPVAEAVVQEIPLGFDPDVPDGGRFPYRRVVPTELELSDDESESEAEFFSQVESSVIPQTIHHLMPGRKLVPVVRNTGSRRVGVPVRSRPRLNR